jgi:tetratricopeptide (TPR) repeat protein
MKRLFAIILIYLTALPVICCGEEFRETMLDRGIRNSEPHAYQLIEKARQDSPESGQLLEEAMKDAPDLPAVYFELAQKSFSLSTTGIFESVNYIIEGLYAYSRNFWWSFTFAGILFSSLVISFVAAIAVIVAIRFPGDLQLFAHDMTEIKYPLFMLIALIVFSFISPFLFLAVMLVMLGMYMKKIDRPVVYIFLIFLAFSPAVFKASSLFMSVMSSPRMKAIIEVNESKDSKRAVTALKNSDDYASLFSYALALKREGNYGEAASIYQKLLQRRPDPKVYVNLGNCYVGLNNMTGAINYYLKGVEMKPLASGYYNLSQISRELLDYTKGNEYFNRALEINRNAVADYRSIYSRNPNRIVVDETLSFPGIWELAVEKPVKTSTFGLSVMPAFFISGTAMLLIIFFALLNSRFRNRAYRCKRCSTILCQRCEKRLIWGQMCPECYASMIKLDALVAKERIARLLAIYEHQKKRRNIMKIFSFLMPGASQIYAGKILYGFLFLWPFLFFLFLPVANVVLSGGGLLSGHRFFTWAAGFLAAGVYIISNIITRQRIAKGWL